MQVPRAPIAQTGVSTLMYVGDDEVEPQQNWINIDGGMLFAAWLSYHWAKDTPRDGAKFFGYGMAAYWLFNAVRGKLTIK